MSASTEPAIDVPKLKRKRAAAKDKTTSSKKQRSMTQAEWLRLEEDDVTDFIPLRAEDSAVAKDPEVVHDCPTSPPALNIAEAVEDVCQEGGEGVLVHGKSPIVTLSSSEETRSANRGTGMPAVETEVGDGAGHAKTAEVTSHADSRMKEPVVLEHSSRPSPFISIPRYSVTEPELPPLEGDIDSDEAYMRMPPVAGSSSRQRDFCFQVDDGVNLLKDMSVRQVTQFIDQLIGPDEAEEMERHTVEGLNAQIARNSLSTYLLAIGHAKGTDHRRRRFAALTSVYREAMSRLSAQDEELATLKVSLAEKEQELTDKRRLEKERQRLESEKKTFQDLCIHRASDVSRLEGEKVALEAVRNALQGRLDTELDAKIDLQEQLDAAVHKGHENRNEVICIQRDFDRFKIEAEAKEETYVETVRQNSELKDDNLKLREQRRKLRYEVDTQASAFNSQVEAMDKMVKQAQLGERIADVFATARTKYFILQKVKEPEFDLESALEEAKAQFEEQCAVLGTNPALELLSAEVAGEEEEGDEDEDEGNIENEEEGERDQAPTQHGATSSSSLPPPDQDPSQSVDHAGGGES